MQQTIKVLRCISAISTTLTYNRPMHLTDRLHAWSQLDPAIAFGETQPIGSKRLKLNITVIFNARQGEHADWLNSSWDNLPLDFETDMHGCWDTLDYVTLGLLSCVIQRGCQAKGWTWAVSQDAHGVYHARVDDVPAEAVSSSFQALLDAYLQRLQRLEALG